MAALGRAARGLCERSLQRAQASSPTVAQDQRRLFRHGSSTGRRLMTNSTVSGKPQPTAGPRSELRMQFEDKKQELFDLCVEMRTTGGFKASSWEDFENLRLTTHLAAQVKPKPDDAIWWSYRRDRYIHDFANVSTSLGFLCYILLGSSDKKEGEATSEANFFSDLEPANKRLN